MELIICTFVLILLIVGAEFDYREHRIPDYVSAGLWFLAFLGSILIDPAISVCIVLSFSLLFFTALILDRYSGTTFEYSLGWGDILTYPIFISFVLILAGYLAPIVIVLSFMLPLIVGKINKRKEALMPYLAFLFLISLIFFLI